MTRRLLNPRKHKWHIAKTNARAKTQATRDDELRREQPELPLFPEPTPVQTTLPTTDTNLDALHITLKVQNKILKEKLQEAETELAELRSKTVLQHGICPDCGAHMERVFTYNRAPLGAYCSTCNKSHGSWKKETALDETKKEKE